MRRVVKSLEFKRIEALPRRVHSGDLLERVKEALTDVLSQDPTEHRLRHIQAIALWECEQHGGLLAPIGVGHGKTLITLLIPTLRDKRALILVPASMVPVLRDHTLPILAEQWRIRPDIEIASYARLSQKDGAEWLIKLAPDIVIADECHKLKRLQSARTKRFVRFFRSKPDTEFYALSGTMTRDSLRDYAHLAELALREGSPLPTTYSDLNDWANAIDVKVKPEERVLPGALEDLEGEGNYKDKFRMRLVETPGVVATSDDSLGCSLQVSPFQYEMTDKLKAAIKFIRQNWTLPNGFPLSDAVDVARHLRTMACGFYYEWIWPNGVDQEWLEARANWNAFVRQTISRGLKRNGIYLDTEGLIKLSCMAGDIDSGGVFAEWYAQSKKEPPEVAPVAFCQESIRNLARSILKLEFKDGPALVWTDSIALGHFLARELEAPYFGAGQTATNDLMDHLAGQKETAVCSIKAHGTGKNLQRYNVNVIASTPSSGGTWEQLLGRTHRAGQEEDRVFAYWNASTQEMVSAFERAVADADHLQVTTGLNQKLSFADKTREVQNGIV